MDGFPARNSEFKALKGSPLVGSCVNNSSPLISRRKIDVAKDMEALILSRQDDPFLQSLATRENSSEDPELNDDSISLIPTSKKKACSKAPSLTILDVHEHMIRSPPPSMLSIGSMEFQFPVNSKPNQAKNNL